jgi:hypothetical protein
MLSVDGIQLAKPLSVRTLQGLVLPSQRIILETAAYPLLSDYLVLLLLVTLRFDTCFISSHGCPCLVATHAVGIPNHQEPSHDP